jgi:hypothetical protein
MKTIISNAATIAALCSTLLSGCIEDSRPEYESGGGVAVKFHTSISKTRAVNDLWEWGDQIGVYMIPADPAAPADPAGSADPDWASLELFAENKRYAHDLDEGSKNANVVFEGADEENTIVWPGGNKKFDVVAYYPWRSTDDITAGYIYPIDLSSQTPQKDIDLMWSDNVRGMSTGSPTLGFGHMLSKLVFNVTDKEGESLVGMTSTFEGLPTTADFSLQSGGIVTGSEGGIAPFAGADAGADDPNDDDVSERAIVEAVVLPGEYPDGYTVTFNLEGGGKALFTIEDPVYLPGKRYIYNIVLTPPSGGDASFGADGDVDQIVDWSEGDDEDKGDYPEEVQITGPGDDTAGEASAAWGPMSLGEASSGGFAVGGDGTLDGSVYKLSPGGVMTITKPGCTGIVSVTTGMKNSQGSVGVIQSVRVGSHELVIDHDNNAATPAQTSFEVPNSTDPNPTYTFRTADGAAVSGNLVVTVATKAGNMNPISVNSLGTNTGI